eukprot:TRINITY_DN10680_c0_g2_i1.p1 TRINITY_DN10680_c0_g2~~TRINITY_DN10680_c0_g2_i1.p1  ORF type:complete len:176 (-),score=12.57 TRINITY_DN10680_c0_g2_i1:1636-2163(-)
MACSAIHFSLSAFCYLSILSFLMSSFLVSSPSVSARALPASQLRKATPSAIANSYYRRCPVEDWAFCMAACPSEETPLRVTLEGGYGAHVGKFLGSAVEVHNATTLTGCCQLCTDFNHQHFKDIFGYICDYWSWEKATGHCSLWDQALVCAAPAHLIIDVFDPLQDTEVSFPAAC